VDTASLPEPVSRYEDGKAFHVYIPGVGGTGVLTLNALLSQAALLDGKHAKSYDQTGAAQKWGAVLSSLLIAREAGDLVTNRVGAGQADLYLACDLLGASEPVNLDRCDPERTAAVINTSVLPSGEMVRQARPSPDAAAMAAAILRFCDPARSVSVDARRLAEGLFGDYMATNVFLLGVAHQSGLLPLSARAIETAIELNDVQVRQNRLAFRYGRLHAADPRSVLRGVEPEPPAPAASSLSDSEARAHAALLERCRGLDDETGRLMAIRIGELSSGETQVGDIVEQAGIHQSGVSRHLHILQAAGFVSMRPDGQRRLYSLKPEGFRELDEWLARYRRLWEARLDRLGTALEDQRRCRLRRRKEKRT
jgi:indolepyruvate ferredoxin oxidoreductase